MSVSPKPLSQLANVARYVPGEAPRPGAGPSYKLASNENPLGASPLAIAAVQEASAHLELYPDGGAGALKAAIGQRFGLPPERIVVGSGSDEIFLMIARAYLGPGDEAISTLHAFAIYAIVGEQQGSGVVQVEERNFTADVDAILAAVTPKTKVVWLANPNNPTGTYLPHDEIKRLHAGLPRSVLLVIDGAYAEFVRRNDYALGVELAAEHENVVVTRTFSKLHGLASLRVGWCFAPQAVVDALEKVRMPFNVNVLAQKAAIASLSDEAFIERSLEHNDRELARLTAGLRALGLEVMDSVCNFVVARFPADPGRAAPDALEFLKGQGITVRSLKGYRMPEHLRISVGTEAANDAVLAALSDFLAAK